MCRAIKKLANFEPAASDEEIRASALQFVRKISGSTKPSLANRAVFEQAVDRVEKAARELIDAFTTTAAPSNREVEAAKAKARASRQKAGSGTGRQR